MKTPILSIDDNPVNLELIEAALDAEFEVISSDGNDSIVELIEKHHPKIILLDIMLEGKSGFDVCKQIRQSDLDPNIVVIFVSSLTTPEDKITAYKVGGDDYVCKPVQIAELRQKLRTVEKRMKALESLSEQIQYATQSAFASMRQASELGQLVNFLEQALEAQSMSDLFALIANYSESLGVEVSCLLRTEFESQKFPVNGISTLESEVLDLGRNADRIMEFGRKILFNSSYATIVAKGLHAYDEEKLGRFKDNFAVLLKIIDSRLSYIENLQFRQNERRRALDLLKKNLAIGFSTIKTEIVEQDNQVQKILTEFAESLSKRIMMLGLDEEQEVEIRATMEELKDSLTDCMDSSVVIDRELEKISVKLNEIN